MAKYVAESKWIASIYPGELPSITKYVGPDPKPNSPRATIYKLKPVPRGSKPFMLEVVDSFENIPNPMKAAESSRSERKGSNMIFDSGIVSCEDLSEALVREWAGNIAGMPVDAGPGIMIVNGTVPTQANLEAMNQRQTVYFEHLYQHAELLAAKNLIDKITQPMRDAATWLGREPKWIPVSNEIISCPECRKDIPWDSRVCSHCRTRLQPISPELAKFNQSVETAA